MKPLVSIVMPTKNRETLIPESINSILEQTYKNWELIVVDDGGTDDTKLLIDFYMETDDRINYYRIDPSGIAKARNYGNSKATGDYIAVCDSDDLMLPDRLEKSVKALKKCDFVYGFYWMAPETLDPNKSMLYVPPKKITLEDIKKNASYPHLTITAKRECFIETPYRNEFKVNDDSGLVWDWWRKGYKATRLNSPVMIQRGHQANTSQLRKKELAEVQKILDKEYEEYENTHNLR